MKYAIVKDNKVIGVTISDSQVGEDGVASDTAEIGYIYDGVNFNQAPVNLEELAKFERDIRSAKLAASDWTQVADSPVDKNAWAVYRQELRDITKQPNFPESFTWPIKP